MHKKQDGVTELLISSRRNTYHLQRFQIARLRLWQSLYVTSRPHTQTECVHATNYGLTTLHF